MVRMLFAVLRSRIVWIGVGAVTVAGVAFVFTVAVTAAVVIAVRGQDVNPREFAEVAVSLGLAAAVAAMAAVVAALRVLRRARARRWLPLYQAMVYDAASAPDTYLAEIVTPNDRAAGSHVVAADLHSGGRGALWMPGTALPRGTVVCFTQTPTGTQVRAWMSRTLWRACAREAASIVKHTASAERERRGVAEEHIRQLAHETVAAVEQHLREHSRRCRGERVRLPRPAGVLLAVSYRSSLSSGRACWPSRAGCSGWAATSRRARSAAA